MLEEKQTRDEKLDKILKALVEVNKASLQDQHDIKKSLKILVANFTGRLNVITEAQASQAKKEQTEISGLAKQKIQEKEQKQGVSSNITNPDIETELDAERQLVADFEKTNRLLEKLIEKTDIGFKRLENALKPDPEKYSRAAAREAQRAGPGGEPAARMTWDAAERRAETERQKAAAAQAEATQKAIEGKGGGGLDIFGIPGGDGPERRSPKGGKQPPGGRQPTKPKFEPRPRPGAPAGGKGAMGRIGRSALSGLARAGALIRSPLAIPAAIGGAVIGGTFAGYEFGGGKDVSKEKAEEKTNKRYIEDEIKRGKITEEQSKKELEYIETRKKEKETSAQTGGTFGGVAGGIAGAKAGAAIGSFFAPGIGTVAGGLIGGLIGGGIGASLGSSATSWMYDKANPRSEESKIGTERGVTIAGQKFGKGDLLTPEQLQEIYKGVQHGQTPLSFVSDQFKKQMGAAPEDMKPEEFAAKLQKTKNKQEKIRTLIQNETASIEKTTQQILSDKSLRALGGPSEENKQQLTQLIKEKLTTTLNSDKEVSEKTLRDKLSSRSFINETVKQFTKTKEQQNKTRTSEKKSFAATITEKTFAEKDIEGFKQYNEFKKAREKELIDSGMSPEDARDFAKADAGQKFEKQLKDAGAIKTSEGGKPSIEGKPSQQPAIGDRTGAAMGPSAGKEETSKGSSLGGSQMTNYLKATALIESSGDRNAKAPTSSATGLFQFIDSTWLETTKKMGKNYSLEDRKDPKKAAEVMEYFTKQNKSQIEKATGKEASNTDLYLAHFMGASGASTFLKAKEDNPNQSAAALNPKAAAANKNIYYDNGRERSVKEVYELMNNKVARAEKAVETGKIGKKDLPTDVAALKASDDTGTSTAPSLASVPPSQPKLSSMSRETSLAPREPSESRASQISPPMVASFQPSSPRKTGDFIYNTNNELMAAKEENVSGGAPIISNVVNNVSGGSTATPLNLPALTPRMQSPLNRYQDKTSAFMGIT